MAPFRDNGSDPKIYIDGIRYYSASQIEKVRSWVEKQVRENLEEYFEAEGLVNSRVNLNYKPRPISRTDSSRLSYFRSVTAYYQMKWSESTHWDIEEAYNKLVSLHKDYIIKRATETRVKIHQETKLDMSYYWVFPQPFPPPWSEPPPPGSEPVRRVSPQESRWCTYGYTEEGQALGQRIAILRRRFLAIKEWEKENYHALSEYVDRLASQGVEAFPGPHRLPHVYSEEYDLDLTHVDYKTAMMEDPSQIERRIIQHVWQYNLADKDPVAKELWITSRIPCPGKIPEGPSLVPSEEEAKLFNDNSWLLDQEVSVCSGDSKSQNRLTLPQIVEGMTHDLDRDTLLWTTVDRIYEVAETLFQSSWSDGKPRDFDWALYPEDLVLVMKQLIAKYIRRIDREIAKRKEFEMLIDDEMQDKQDQEDGERHRSMGGPVKGYPLP